METQRGARLFVCERRGDWAAALRRRATSTAIVIHELRSAAAALEELNSGLHHVLVWQVRQDKIAALLTTLHTQRRYFPHSCALVVGVRELASFEWVLREAGAVHCSFGMRNLDPLLRIALRHLAKAPAVSTTWHARLEHMLPWPAVSSAGFSSSASPEPSSE